MRVIYISLVVLLLGSCAKNTENKTDQNPIGESPVIETRVDHVIMAINNLDSGIHQMKELTGVEPVFGGEHPNSFTQNALISLGNGTYVEILAPRPNVDSIPEWIQELETLTPYGWAVGTNNVKELRNIFESESTSELRPGSRLKPDGETLSWTTFGLTKIGAKSIDQFNSAGIPFFIQWGENTEHPSTTSPEGCTLRSVIVTSNKSEELNSFFSSIKINRLKIMEGDEKLNFILNTPNGQITF